MNGSLLPVLSGCVSRAAFFHAFLQVQSMVPVKVQCLPNTFCLKFCTLKSHATSTKLLWHRLPEDSSISAQAIFTENDFEHVHHMQYNQHVVPQSIGLEDPPTVYALS